MFVFDLNGDGRNDVVTSKDAHGYGLSWFENVREGDEIKFQEHLIMGEKSGAERRRRRVLATARARARRHG